MKFACLLLLATASLSIFGYDWTVPDTADWRADNEGGVPTLHLLTGKEPPASGPRRPFQFAIAKTAPFRRVRIDVDAKALGSSLIIVFAYLDSSHFDYAHLSSDAATKQPHHNGIFHVYGGERVRISSVTGPAAFPPGHTWNQVQLNWDGRTGNVDAQVNGAAVPALHAVDASLTEGRIGLGSFDETAEFRNLQITGTN
jgi:hypothetical protein